MSFKDNLEKLFYKKNIFLFSTLFTLNFYYFKFSLVESINFKIKLPPLLYLFLFQLIILFLIKFFFTKITNLKIRKSLDLIFQSWLLVIIFQTCFFFYSQISLNDFLENIFQNLNVYEIVILKPLKILTPYIFFSIIVFFLNKKNYSIFKFYKVTTIILLVFFFYRETFLYTDSYFPNLINKKPIIQKDLKIDENQSVTIWVLFDEYDPKFIEELKLNNNLESFNQLKKESLYFENIIPNAKQTKFSMMGILTGFNFVNLSIKNKEVFLINNKNKKLKYDFKNTIFQKLLDNNNDFVILSTVTKYCSVYFKNYDIDNCYEWSKKLNFFDQLSFFNIKNYSGIFFHYSIINYIKAFFKKLDNDKIQKTYNLKNYQKILNLNSDLEINDFDGRNFITIKKIEKLIESGQHSLIFSHVYLPHLPSTYSENKLNYKLDNNDRYGKYLLNLKYNDLIIKQLLKMQKKNKKINLIISSDHWFREKDMKTKNYYESLLAVKLGNDDEYFIENRKYNASVMYHIVDSIINNESKTHKDIIKDLGGTKYSEPCYIKNCLN